MKVKIKCQINDYVIDTTGFLENNIILFKDKDEDISYDFENLVLTKKEYILNFYSRKCIFNNNFYVPVTIISISNNKENHEYKNVYKIGEQNFTLFLSYEYII